MTSRGRHHAMCGGTCVALLMLAASASCGAQSRDLVERLNRIADGSVRFSYATRPDVCSHGESSISWRNSFFGSLSEMRDDDWRRDCVHGPAVVTVQRQGGATVAVRIAVAHARSDVGSVQDWGTVSTGAAARLLMQVAQTASGRPAQRAMLAAAIADSEPVIWPQLLRIAKDAERPRSARQEARFWLARLAADHAFGPQPDDFEKRGDDERGQAVFALSQLPGDQGVPDLITIARTHRDPIVRRKALFWLGQSEDDRALAVFEELLVRTR